VQAVDQDQPVLAVQTVAQLLADQRWWYRTWGGMFGIFAAIALVLATVGLYAVIAYSVTQRTQEIGLRMALGAARRAVSWMILRRAVAQLGAGLVLGLPGAWLMTHILWDGGLAAITPGDPVTYIAITMLLLTVCVAAALQPAWRATRIDPLVALREE
jgi:ABC-type antimicrobial peptide transport system permease subunit